MARVNLSIPDELKSKMDEMGGKANWSNIARDAFSIVVASHLAKADPNMQTQIERLRAERTAALQEDAADGLKRGKEMALSMGFRELQKLCRFDDEHYAYRLASSDIALADCLVSHTESDDIEALFGQTDVSETFAENFLKGAREILFEVSRG